MTVTAVLTCPHCGLSTVEQMPSDACIWFYECLGCQTLLRPKQGDCCVFCSYGDAQCPPRQRGECGRQTTDSGPIARRRARPTVIVADDHPAMRAALVRLIAIECDVVATVADGDALVRAARRLAPDVVVSDLFMPVLDGFAAGRQLKRELPATRLIYVTGAEESEFIAEALRTGAVALVSKANAGMRLLPVIRRATLAEAMEPAPALHSAAASMVATCSFRCCRADRQLPQHY